MFCSNQKFELCGNKRDEKVLKDTMSLICGGFDFKPRCYNIKKDGFLYFYKYLPSDKNEVIEICEEDRNMEYYLKIIELYFSSYKYKHTLKNHVFNEFFNADGSSQEGWELFLDNKGLNTFIVIKPYWCFYHK